MLRYLIVTVTLLAWMTAQAAAQEEAELRSGVVKIGSKLTEEAAEIVAASAEPGEAGRQHTVREAADLVYHLLILLAAREIALADVEAELARRFGMSGLEEKASRIPQK